MDEAYLTLGTYYLPLHLYCHFPHSSLYYSSVLLSTVKRCLILPSADINSPPFHTQNLSVWAINDSHSTFECPCL